MIEDGTATLRLADRAAILDVAARFARGSDRFDAALMASCYWPGAIDNHGGFNGPFEQYIEWCLELTRPFERMAHVLGQSLFEFVGDAAAVETAFTFFATLRDGRGERVDVIQVGRYVDRFERREGEWRIAVRQVVFDWKRELPGATGWDGFLEGSGRRIGRPGADDPLYALLRGVGSPSGARGE
jgi:hypothetical protein